MNQVVCNYAPLRFLPYREVGEFINIGVVAHCPQTGYFGFKTISPRRTGRVKHFFPELQIHVFKAALEGVRRELKRVEAEHQALGALVGLPPALVRDQTARFAGLVRKREGLLHFGEPGSILVSSGTDALDLLFNRYVERHFARRPEYHETIMRNRLDHLLRQWHLQSRYARDEEIGDEDFHVTMPFVHRENTVPVKVIRPLDLNKKEPTDIYQHGGAWVKNMERLKNRNTLPTNVIFTVELPDTGKRLQAANTICAELRELDILPVPFRDTARLHEAVQV